MLSRWFPAGKVHASVAQYLDIILYSREQIIAENKAMGKEPAADSAAWGVVSIKAQDEDFELPMTPITMMRNTMISEGGSGVAIDRAAYARAVQYWEHNAMIA